MNVKTCRVCGESKVITDFYKNKNHADGHEGICKICRGISIKKYRQNNPDRIREIEKKSYQKHSAKYKREFAEKYTPEFGRERTLARYGLTIEEYEEKYNAQSGKCSICYEVYDVLCVDHSHETREVRGLLCKKCNMALGLLGDNPDRLQAAMNYLMLYLDSELPA